ncbi:hypothetical protein AWM70_21020 [Paenibacillus yonginensis]|uniref:HTH tetR-type domain-containing protein n=1 Tax=Paenibacillus yonginensis TaxID=1462996 RepID=A0A1B1N5P2_9BACL|nr:TetR/AcrR family transcriptional regulator [Paenibacillus yonginensis]ANS76758.1 hypothetical protein AWM70_21020 [Paenibacillus yonginensis]
MNEQPAVTGSFKLILDTAETLIGEKGCRKTTLQDIIDRSGLSKGAIYHYVSGKDELFGLILRSRMESMNASFEKAVEAAGERDAATPTRALAEGLMNGASKDSVSNKIFTYLLAQSDQPKVTAILNELYRHSVELAERWIAIGQQAGAIPAELDAGRLAASFIVFSYGLRVQKVVANESDPTLKMEDIFGLLFKSLQ